MSSNDDKNRGPQLPRDREVLFLVDGPSQMFRAFYAIRGLSTREGLPTGAVYGFTSMLRKVLKDYRPHYLAVAFDTSAPTFRHEKYEDYKADRPDMPEELAAQLPHVKKVCDILGAPLLEKDGWEADDVMATLARKAADRDLHTVLVTQDKDLFQLVDDHTWILYASGRGGEDRLLDPEGVADKFGVPPEHVADVLALMGDSVDNIPGIPGIGEKGARKLVSALGSLDALLAEPSRAEEISGLRGAARYARLLEEHADQARMSLDLIHLDEDAPVELDLEAFRCVEPDTRAAFEFFKQMQFNSLMKEFSSESRVLETDYATVLGPEELDGWLDRARKAGTVALDTETTSLNAVQADIVGFSLAVEPGHACYVPLAHRGLDMPTQLDAELALGRLQELVADDSLEVVGQNLKYDLTVLERAGVTVSAHLKDTMVAAYVLNPTRGSFGLDSLASEFLGHQCIPYEEVCGKGKDERPFEEVGLETATRYAAEDADVALRLWKRFLPDLEAEEGLQELFETMEMPLVPILARMERAGIRLDLEVLEEMSATLAAELEKLTARIYEEAGVEFNINSPKQLGEVLFRRLELPVLRKTQKTGAPSTSEAVLSKLAEDYDIPRLILEYRELQKLKSTYVDALPHLVNPETGRIHPSYHQAVAATGRLSSSEPNIQNIPIRTELGRKIRRAFIPREGWKFLAADYSQVELRVLAHMAGDPKLIDTFRRGEDVHRRTAAEVFDVDPEEVTRQQRSRAKAVNFGILYGMGPQGLSQQIGVSYKEAKAFIERYFERYPKVQEYIDATLDTLREKGQVTTLFHRVRRFPEVATAQGARRSFVERAAINTTIQGTAADLMKMAMIRLDRSLEKRGVEARMIMQIHDELVLEAPEEELEDLQPLVREAMEGVYELRVPLAVDMAVGDSWYEV